VIAWLWSEEGLKWAKDNIKRVHHRSGYFADIKLDHECHYGGMADCSGYIGESLYPDGRIRQDINDYGIWGVPQEWKDRAPLL
jgi:hypothetical protein